MCTKIVRDILAEWNERPQVQQISLSDLIDRRVARRLALASRSLSPSGLLFLAGGSESIASDQLSVLTGRAHGDLSARNVLVNISPEVAPSYFLVDLGSYSSQAPLSHDPVRLILSMAGSALEGLSDLQRAELINAILAPSDPGRDLLPRWLNGLVRDGLSAAEQWASRFALLDEWRRQVWLSVVSEAFSSASNIAYSADDRRWFLHLAVQAAGTVSRSPQPGDQPFGALVPHLKASDAMSGNELKPDVRAPSLLLSAPIESERAFVAASLRLAGFQVLESEHFTSSNQSFADGLIHSLDVCDAVVAIVVPGASDAVLVEIGIALGRGIPVVVVTQADTDRASLPMAIQDLPAVSVSRNSAAAFDRLATMIRLLASARVGGSTQRADPKEGTPGYIAEIREQFPEGTLARDVAVFFASAGARIISELRVSEADGSSSSRADFAAWIPGVLSATYNPVVVEVRSVYEQRAELQLRSYLNRLGLYIGLMITEDPIEQKWSISNGTVIGLLGVGQLRSMSPAELWTMLKAGRNMLVHGVH
jgi:hypothetical protein